MMKKTPFQDRCRKDIQSDSPAHGLNLPALHLSGSDDTGYFGFLNQNVIDPFDFHSFEIGADLVYGINHRDRWQHAESTAEFGRFSLDPVKGRKVNVAFERVSGPVSVAVKFFARERW